MWTTSTSGYHHESAGLAESFIKIFKKLLQQVCRVELISSLEFQHFCDMAVAMYHSFPVVSHPSSPGRWASRDLLLHGPQSSSYFFVGNSKNHSLSSRWDVIDKILQHFHSVLNEKCCYKMILPHKDRKNSDQEYQVSDIVLVPDLQRKGSKTA